MIVSDVIVHCGLKVTTEPLIIGILHLDCRTHQRLHANVGSERAQAVARETMRDVREAMGLSY